MSVSESLHRAGLDRRSPNGEARPEFASAFGLPEASQAKLRALGTGMNADVFRESQALFAPLHDTRLPEGAAEVRDIAFGLHPRQALDICRPACAGAPVVLFVPGGGFTSGSKDFYAHIPRFFAGAGFVGVSMNYRLAPEARWPAGARDVAQAIEWLGRNVAEHGGDPDRLFVVAQSAGATHASATLFDRRFRPRNLGSVRAAVLMSGLYEITSDLVPVLSVYFGDDPGTFLDRSPVRNITSAAMPFAVTLAELDPPVFGVQTGALLRDVTARDGFSPPLAWLRGHNHVSPVLGMGCADDRLGPAIGEYFRTFAG